MVKIVICDLSEVDCGGGYGDGECIYIDSRKPKDIQKIIIVHEVIENSARNLAKKPDPKVIKIAHPYLDFVVLEILNALNQWEKMVLYS